MSFKVVTKEQRPFLSSQVHTHTHTHLKLVILWYAYTQLFIWKRDENYPSDNSKHRDIECQYFRLLRQHIF